MEALIQLLEERQRILWVHFAPSCGTASRSRERPLKHLEKMGYEVPKPLRNDQRPMGIPGLVGKDLAKVLSANATYAAMLRVCQFCWASNIAISIENPGNSLFWKIPSVQRFLQEVAGYDAVFHHCVHGGLRDKLTRWWASVDWFLPLAILCDKTACASTMESGGQKWKDRVPYSRRGCLSDSSLQETGRHSIRAGNVAGRSKT